MVETNLPGGGSQGSSPEFFQKKNYDGPKAVNEPFRVGMAVYRNVSPRTVGSLTTLAQAYPDIGFHFEVGSDNSLARNEISARAKILGIPRLLFVDSDIGFEVEQVKALHKRLDENPKAGVVAGIYPSWDGKQRIVCGWMKPEGGWYTRDECTKRARRLCKKKKLAEVDSFGMGFALIDTEVFDRVPAPWFLWRFTDDGNYCGEDVDFILKLKEYGYEPKVDFGIQVTHTGPVTWGIS